MAIAGPCSKSPVAPDFQADARSAASGVEDDSTAALSSMKAYEVHRSGNAHSGVPHSPIFDSAGKLQIPPRLEREGHSLQFCAKLRI